jgi:hypothetical protein
MVAMIEALEPGIHAMVDHPATDTPEMRRVGHVGNTNVAEQRAGILHAWTHPSVRAVIERRLHDLCHDGRVVPDCANCREVAA